MERLPHAESKVLAKELSHVVDGILADADQASSEMEVRSNNNNTKQIIKEIGTKINKPAYSEINKTTFKRINNGRVSHPTYMCASSTSYFTM
jgi:hypothetical protein